MPLCLADRDQRRSGPRAVKTFRRVGGLLAPYRGRVILAFLLTALACLLNLPVPLLVQALVDRVVAGGRAEELPW